MSDLEQQTHFGYEQVPVGTKQQRVNGVFHSVAGQYDLMNDLMSFGVHRIWKKMAVHLSHCRPGHEILDLASGTGDLAFAFSQVVGDQGRVILADINASMLAIGRDRLIDRGAIHNTAYVQANGEALPFPEGDFDLVTIGFGLRNITDKKQALREMFRVLKPGGKALVLEFSTPTTEALKKLYDIYSFSILPKLGEKIANDSKSYQYLAESIRMHPDQQILQGYMEEAGFEGCDYHNISGGIVAIHRGYKY